MRQVSAAATDAVRAWQRVYTPPDLAFNGITWAKGATPGVGGTLSLDIPVWGHRALGVYATSDNAWALDMAPYSEDDTFTMPFAQVLTFPGGNYVGAFVVVPVWAVRVRFLGRGLGGAATPNSFARVFARS